MYFWKLFRVALFTILQAGISTLLAIMIALPLAFFCAKRKFVTRRFLLSLSTFPLCIPSLLVTLGYVTFLGMNGGLNKFLMFVFGLKEPPIKILYSFFGLVIAHAAYNFPLILKTVSSSWQCLPTEHQDAARLLGASESKVFRTITLPFLIPSIASSAMITFIYCFLSFILVLLFGGVGNSTLEVEIYKAARTTLDFKKAVNLSILETVILSLITFAYCIIEQWASRLKGLQRENKIPSSKIRGAKEWTVFIIMFLIVLIFFICPIGGIFVNAFSSKGKSFWAIFKMRSFLPSLKNTLITSTLTASLCTIFGFSYTLILLSTNRIKSFRLKSFLSVLPMLQMCVSSVVLGLILSLIVKRGNILLLVLAQSILYWPIAFRQINPIMQKTANKTLESAILLSRNRFDALFRVIIPSTKKSIFTAFCFCFSLSAGDTTLPLVMAIPKYTSLSLFTYRLAGAYRFNEACSAGIILGAICFLVFQVGTLASEKSHREKTHGENTHRRKKEIWNIFVHKT